MADRRVTMETAPGATPALVRWGAVMGGGVIGLSLLVLLAALWLALAFGTGVAAIEANLDWLLAVSAIVALFVSGLVAGWLSGVPGFAPGFFNGLTVWAAIVVVTLVITAPGALFSLRVPGTDDTVGVLAADGAVFWAAFVALLIGAIAAALGGGLGGVTTRPAFVFAASPATAADEAPDGGAATTAETDAVTRGDDADEAVRHPDEGSEGPAR